MADQNNEELRKQLKEVRNQIKELPLDAKGNPQDKEYANSLSAKELDLITKIYVDA